MYLNPSVIVSPGDIKPHDLPTEGCAVLIVVALT